jgi:hypothetical protein
MSLFSGAGGTFLGVQGPQKRAGKNYWPQHLQLGGTARTLTTTAARQYSVPFYVDRPTTFAGAWAQNSGAGDNGDKIKIAAFVWETGVLAKSFGEVTLTGAAALRQFASSWAASPGWYDLRLISDNTVDLYAYNAMISAAGPVEPLPADQLGTYDAPTIAANTLNSPLGDYVAGVYANFPEATALTTTNTLRSSTSGGTFPSFGLYV